MLYLTRIYRRQQTPEGWMQFLNLDHIERVSELGMAYNLQGQGTTSSALYEEAAGGIADAGYDGVAPLFF